MGDVEDDKPKRPGKDTQIREKDAQLLAEKDRQIAELSKRAETSEINEDAAKAETVDAWKWSSNAWRNTFLGSWFVAAVIVGIVAGLTYLDIEIPGVGHLKLSVDAQPERAAPKAERTNEAVETLDEEPRE